MVASDPLEAGWPEHVRDGKVELGSFYPVEYDSSDPKNSKIIITKKPYSIAQLFKNGIQVQGKVDKVMKVSTDYVDLKISYSYNKVSYNFRTRIHKDSLPCGTQVTCKGSPIQLKVSKFSPELNDLYFKSYDRKHRFNQNEFK